MTPDSPSLVELDADHPGFRDPAYRQRRNQIAAIALAHEEPSPVARVEYLPEEHQVWREVWKNLTPLHQQFAAASYHGLVDAIGLSRRLVPQLCELNQVLGPMHGFQMLPVAGLVQARHFLERLSEGVFLSTQYMRHQSVPLYTPEPDVVHEIIGHAATFASSDFCELNRAFGRAARRANDDETIERIARIYWYTLEFGVVEEGGQRKVYGAGLLSSFGELQRFDCAARLRAFDLEVMAATPYDPTHYQEVLYVAADFATMVAEVKEWLERI